MANKNYGPQKSETTHKHALRDAFDRSTRWFGNLLAPLVIIAYARDAQQALDYLIERPLLIGTFALVFIIILAYNLLRTINIQFGGWPWRWQSARKAAAKNGAPVPSETNSTEEPVKGPRGRALLRWTAILGSLVALVLLVYVYVVVFVTGLHFVAVASAPDKASAIREIQSLNRFFKEEGYTDLEARTHASTATGIGWYMISIGGPHTSQEAAEATFRRAKQALGPRMRSDSYIYSTENTSPVRVMRNWVRGILLWFVK